MPNATARDFPRVARLLGFTLTRQTGSHERLFFKIVRQLGVSLDEFAKLR